ncbi:MAG: hypothetical protein DRG39_06200, partial [Deltaproteobacteria bacterium]
PCYPYVIYSKDKNLCISQTIRVFLFCSTGNRLYFFNEISDLFGIKIGFAKLGLGGRNNRECGIGARGFFCFVVQKIGLIF